MIWALADAKNRFSEVVERAMTEGPQRVMRRGSDAVVVLSAKEYAQLRGPNKSFKDHLMSAPPALAALDLKRDTSSGREIEL